MKKILHLFPRLLSLYGEYGNLVVLKNALEKGGFEVSITACEDGIADFGAYDLVYAGAGTEDNLLEAASRLENSAQSIQSAAHAGTLFLATGNAMTLFGKTVIFGSRQTAGVSLLPYTTTIREDKRYLGDVLTTDSNVCAARTLGFINTSCVYTGVEKPLLVLELGKTLGNDKASSADGALEPFFIGTQLIGPFLAKNPHFLSYVYGKLTGETLTLSPDCSQVRAYDVAAAQLLARLEK